MGFFFVQPRKLSNHLMEPATNLLKISPPKVRGVLHRPRLIEQINKYQDKRLLLILGQAAQGKSTLAAGYVATLENPVAWLNLDQGDSDPVNLFYWIVNAFQFILPDLDLSSLRSYPSTSRGPREEIPLYREWVQAIFDRIADPVHLVLDGLDRLLRKASSFLFLQTLAYETPPHVHLILLSREEPPLGIQGLKMKQEAYILTNDDLAFRLEETRAYFREIRRMPLPAMQVAKIHSFTEGWVGGLILFSEALERLSEGEREKFISEKIPDRFRMEIFQFFGEEILASQPSEIQEFLVKSAILDKIEPELARHFTDTGNMEEVLHDAARRNLFVQSSFEEGRGWVFRYHQLFRDFLLLKFNSEFTPEDRQSLYYKTALLYEQRGRLEEAITYFLKAGAYESAVPAIEKAGMDLVWAGRTTDLLQWLKALPEETVQKNPWLLFYLSMTRRFTAVAENLVSLHKAYTLFEQACDSRGRLLSLAALIESTILRGHDLVPLSVLLTKGENLLNTLGHDLYPRERATLWSQIGFALTVRADNPRKGYWACQNAYLIAKDLGEIVLQIDSLIHAYQALVYLGEFPLADEKSKELEQLIEKCPYSEVVIFYHIILCEVFIFRGDFKKAVELMQFGEKECERLGLSYLYPITMLYEVALKPHLEQYREAEEIGQRFLEFSNTIGNSYMAGIALFYLGRSFYFAGMYERAEEYLQKSRDILSEEKTLSPFQLNLTGILNGFIHRAGAQDASILNDLQESLDHFSSISCFLAIDAHFAMAHLLWRREEKAKAASHLHSGFKMAREKGYDHFVFISPRDLTTVCGLAIELADQQDSDYAAYLLSTRLAHLAGPELERLSKHPIPRVRARASKIKLSLHRPNLPPLKIETLGRFRVIRAGSSVKEEEWHGSQTKNLLKAIVARGSEGVRKEVLIESLWPEGRPDKAEKTFKVALHRLRRILDPEMEKGSEYSHIRLKDNRIFLDKEICEVDVDKFLALFNEGGKREKSGNIKEALAVYKEAAALYRGDFLPEEGNVRWADSRREDLRRRYLELLFKIARIYEDGGAPQRAISVYRKTIEFDPLAEEAYKRLMILYAAMGQRNEALKTYKSCEKALHEGLNAEPEELTLSLYKKIQNP
jgi:two-component SAPR family response regulator